MSPFTLSMEDSIANNLEKHAALVKTITEFDRVDIGERVTELPQDLNNVKNILVTGGAGFM
jgi:UDP-glucose 4,6-dehydratase